MKIAVDVMGGDNAPGEIVLGALDAARAANIQVLLVGDRKAISEYTHNDLPKNVTIYHCSETIDMDEQPANAIRKKKDASVSIATKLVKEGEADALVSAGNTGAQMACALFMLGRMAKVQRPAIAAVIPGLSTPKLLLDAGANIDCRPENLMEFAVMGGVYSEKVLGIANSVGGLLSIGTEPYKGGELTKKTYDLLSKSQLNFYGNIEARDILGDDVDVIVCDGFIGNSLLKFAEGLGHLFYNLLGEVVNKSLFTKAGGLLLLSGVKELQHKLDWQEYGGAPLLGVDGVSVVCHGGSKAKAIKNAIKVAGDCVKNNFVTQLRESINEEKVKSCHMV